MNIHLPNDCSATSHLPFLVWSCIRATTVKLRPLNCQLLSPKTLYVLGRRLLGLLFNYSGYGTWSQATPGLLNAWNHVLGLEDQFSATEDAVVHLDTFWITAT